MADPSLDLQGAIVAALKADGAVTALVGQRIFDDVPAAQAGSFPRITYGSDQVLSDDADCVTGFEVFIQIDVWSRIVGQPEMKRIAGAVRAALHNVELTLAEHSLIVLEHQQTRYLRDPDGLTKHAAVEFRALADA